MIQLELNSPVVTGALSDAHGHAENWRTICRTWPCGELANYIVILHK